MEKVNIIQIGVCHEHANGKFATLKKLPGVFNVIGYVDERDFCKTPFYSQNLNLNHYEGYRKLTLDEALNYPGLEAVTVEVPNNDLVPVALKCMEHNLAMHLDKPAGEDLALYKKLLDGCKARKLPFQMGYMFRGNPAFQFCIRAIREKLLGDVFEIEADMNHCYGAESYQEYIGKFSGGIMYNLDCHLIDFVVAAMGRPENVTPFLKSAPGYPASIRNNCMAVLEYPQALVTLRSCSKDACNTGGRAINIAGTKGTIKFSPLERFDGKSVEIKLTLAEDSGLFPKGSHTLCFPPQRDRYEGQLMELAQVIRCEATSTYSFEHDYLVHEVTLAASNYINWRRN
ncbi:MAG: Gfo/Idh/MocA family oxidoreductase [Victivallales bacterium]|nr:Gfo/Idh/MocA family oxidoreductase [Victivallales bacterium]